MLELNHKICIVDDDPAVLDSLKLMLETVGADISTFGEGSSFLRSELQRYRGCILLDVRLPGDDGLTVLKKALAINPNLQIIMMSGHGDIAMAIAALKSGAQDFIEKPFKADEIMSKLTAACEGLIETEAERKFAEQARSNLALLTPRENDVLDRLVEGKPNKIIAFELGISVRTVETYRARILQKTRVRSLAELVKMHVVASER
jgi:two-component system response regulator FixJ